MTRIRLTLAILLGITITPDASAQFFQPVFGAPVIVQNGIDFQIGGRRLRISGFIPTGNPYTVIVPVTPYGRGLRQVGPAFLPYGYYGYGYPVYGSVEQNITVQVFTAPSVLPPRFALQQVDVSGIDLDVEPASKIWGEKPALAKGGKGAAARKGELLAAAPQAEQKVQAAANPVKEAPAAPKIEPLPPNGQNLNDMGVTAFRTGEYGVALLRFRQAVDAEAPVPRALFLQAQSYIAVGKYREAVENIQKGLHLQPNFPDSGFQPRIELYDKDDDLFRDHRKRLDQTHEQDPKNADYLFLLGYHYWFDGQRDIAADYFRRSRELAAEPRWADAFLKLAKNN